MHYDSFYLLSINLLSVCYAVSSNDIEVVFLVDDDTKSTAPFPNMKPSNWPSDLEHIFSGVVNMIASPQHVSIMCEWLYLHRKGN